MYFELFIKKLILLLVYLFLPQAIFAQFFDSDAKIDKQIIENISEKYLASKTDVELKILLAKQLQSKNLKTNKSKEIISDVFLATKSAADKDALNATSTYLFKKALLGAKKANREDLAIWATVQYGYYLYTYRKYEESFPSFMYAIRHLDNIGAEDVIEPFETYKKIAYFLMTTGDYKTANNYLLLAKNHAKPNSSEMATIIDNLGLNCVNENNLIQADKYFNDALLIAAASKDTLRYGKALGNIAEIKFKQGDYKKAILLLNHDIAISKQQNNKQNSIYALVLLAKTYVAIGNVKEANIHLQLAKEYTNSKTYLKSAAYEINSLILDIAKQTGNDKEELKARRNLENLKKALANLDGRDAIMKLGWQMEKQKLQLTAQEEKAKREREALIKIITLAGCLLLLVLIAFLIRHYQQKIKNEKAEYDQKILRIMLDKVNSEQKLYSNHQTLASYKSYLAEKNNQIAKLEFEIAKINNSSAVYLETYSIKMQSLLSAHLMDNNSWLDFKGYFTQTYADYYETLMHDFPKLTDSHLRLVFLSKLEMNNMEVARILGLTIDAVKKAKQRLKKKYGDKYNLLFEQKETEVFA